MNSQGTISRELALRIGLAARTLAAAFVFALLATAPIILLLCQIDRILIWSGTAPQLAAMALVNARHPLATGKWSG